MNLGDLRGTFAKYDLSALFSVLQVLLSIPENIEAKTFHINYWKGWFEPCSPGYWVIVDVYDYCWCLWFWYMLKGH